MAWRMSAANRQGPSPPPSIPEAAARTSAFSCRRRSGHFTGDGATIFLPNERVVRYYSPNQKESFAVPDPLEAAAPTAALSPPAEARAAWLKKFKREQRIVEYLNRGVSVAEIAAQVGVGEKRLRAIMREILARRMPHPPMEFVAIQMSRLNEALLVAYSAMSLSNLKAVDQVVKIVRELDRYGGAFAAEWARPAASRLDAPAEADVAFAKAWLGGGELKSESSGDRPEFPLQGLEKIESAPGFLRAPEASADAGAAPEGRPAGEAARRGVVAAGCPEILTQSLEKIDSAPGFIPLAPRERYGMHTSVDGRAPLLRRRPGKSLPPGEDPASPGVAPKATDGVWPAASTRIALHRSRRDPTAAETGFPHPIRRAPPDTFPSKAGKGGASSRDSRPQNPAQSLERNESTPGIGLVSETTEASAGPVSTPDLMLSLLRSAAGRQDLRACLSRQRAGTYGVAPPDDGGDFSVRRPGRLRSPGNSGATP